MSLLAKGLGTFLGMGSWLGGHLGCCSAPRYLLAATDTVLALVADRC